MIIFLNMLMSILQKDKDVNKKFIIKATHTIEDITVCTETKALVTRETIVFSMWLVPTECGESIWHQIQYTIEYNRPPQRISPEHQNNLHSPSTRSTVNVEIFGQYIFRISRRVLDARKYDVSEKMNCYSLHSINC